jgi:hypothetical protein
VDGVVDGLVVVLALAVSAGLGWLVVAGVLRLASRSGDAGSTSPTSPTGAAPAGAPAGTTPAVSIPVPGAVGSGPDPAAVPAGAGPSPAASSDGPEGPRAKAVLRGGTWIGILERLAVTGCVLLGDPEGIAAVIAVKGLGRYPELRENPGASERFVIGTLASLVWAVAVGALGRALLV